MADARALEKLGRGITRHPAASVKLGRGITRHPGTSVKLGCGITPRLALYNINKKEVRGELRLPGA